MSAVSFAERAVMRALADVRREHLADIRTVRAAEHELVLSERIRAQEAESALAEALRQITNLTNELEIANAALGITRAAESPWIEEWRAATGKSDALPDYGGLLLWARERTLAAEAALADPCREAGCQFSNIGAQCVEALGMANRQEGRAIEAEAALAEARQANKARLAALVCGEHGAEPRGIYCATCGKPRAYAAGTTPLTYAELRAALAEARREHLEDIRKVRASEHELVLRERVRAETAEAARAAGVDRPRSTACAGSHTVTVEAPVCACGQVRLGRH